MIKGPAHRNFAGLAQFRSRETIGPVAELDSIAGPNPQRTAGPQNFPAHSDNEVSLASIAVDQPEDALAFDDANARRNCPIDRMGSAIEGNSDFGN